MNVSTIGLSIVLVLFHTHSGTSLIIPEELPTILSLIYSNIPPIKKGTDSRVGVGFRLGEHADFQILVEMGPQTETEPIGNSDTKRRRQVMIGAAMRGELGPVTQAIAKYQTERRIRKEIERLELLEEKLKKMSVQEKMSEKPSTGSDWLTKWSAEMSRKTHVPLKEVSREKVTIDPRGILAEERGGNSTLHTRQLLEELLKLQQLQNSSEKT
ncbi:uncharacterized protein snsl [Prorops nasuta]|uniref:uncharacterized protein snsl n=1 Tax=Prorops nasuta TaxID=863751 RepID=UPI0034CDD992